MVVKWTRRALSDLGKIADYIAQDKPAAALEWVADIRRKVGYLEANPFMGRASSGQNVRELVVHKSYLVTYRIILDEVQVLQVWNTRQNRR